MRGHDILDVVLCVTLGTMQWMNEYHEMRRVKHVDIRLNHVWEALKDGLVERKYASSKEKHTDIMVKTVTGNLFVTYRGAFLVAPN